MSRSSDVIGMDRDWCGARWRGALSSRGVCLCNGVLTSPGCGIGARFVNAQKWREKSSLFLRSKENKRYLKKKCRKEDTLRFGGERENVLKDQREVQATKGRLERKRQGVAVKLIQRNQRAEGRAPHS